MGYKQLPVPPHFDETKVGKVWRVPYQRRAQEAEAWAERYELEPAVEDRFRTALLAIDCQNTFCIPGYGLFVAGRSGRGAIEDNVRLCEFIYRNLGSITHIAATMDTHMAIQIFHPVFWVDEKGRHPKGGETVISVGDVEKGVWRVNPAVAAAATGGDYEYLKRYALHYVRSLAQGGKYPLLIWPYHAILGGIGHALVPAVEEAMFFHTVARKSQTSIEIKGESPLTEHYSALGPEVREGPEREVVGQQNTEFVDRLLDFDALVIAGQAKSHCVSWTVQDMLEHIKERDTRLVERVYLLEDCTSPVVVSGVVDFTEQADEAFTRFADAGMHVVSSTDPMKDWPGIKL